MTKSLRKEDVIESLSLSQITEGRNRHLENECLLKLMCGPECHQSFTWTGVDDCRHISCETSDRIWASDQMNNLILTNKRGVTLYHARDLCTGYNGPHTVNSESELFYIDRNYNINKLSKDMKTIITFIEKTDSTWRPWCVYWSPSSGDLLVGIYREKPRTGKVARYNQSGQLIQIIQHDNKGRGLYREPHFITENNNGDVVVSDRFTSVVVTERGGRHRFSYTTHPSGSGLLPYGICTDALSRILVCDGSFNTVQMLDKNGRFLSHLLIGPARMFNPNSLYSLSYDVITHRLWVGSLDGNKVCVYRYITREDAMTDQSHVKESLSEIQSTGTEKPEQGKECLLLMMSPPKLLHSLTVTDVDCCYHITCVTPGLVLVNDDKHNLILANTTGDILHRVKKICSGLDEGLHTVNSNSELIYIDSNHNINKLSMDMKTTSTFIERTNPRWRPMCVYWSPLNGDLLVGMFCNSLIIGKVNRYNQSGQLTQTIQHDNTGLNLYSKPNYITENNNGDVVVSDNDLMSWSSPVVVTERGGRHRFSYTGHPPKSELLPNGICTDALSHILVCDRRTKTVQMINKDGQFLSNLLIRPPGIFYPRRLSYDVTITVSGSDHITATGFVSTGISPEEILRQV